MSHPIMQSMYEKQSGGPRDGSKVTFRNWKWAVKPQVLTANLVKCSTSARVAASTLQWLPVYSCTALSWGIPFLYDQHISLATHKLRCMDWCYSCAIRIADSESTKQEHIEHEAGLATEKHISFAVGKNLSSSSMPEGVMVASRMRAICLTNLSRGFRPMPPSPCKLSDAPVPCTQTQRECMQFRWHVQSMQKVQAGHR